MNLKQTFNRKFIKESFKNYTHGLAMTRHTPAQWSEAAHAHQFEAPPRSAALG